MEEIFCKIHGRVQMVMFRDFICRKARSRGLRGFVRNKLDGSVEVLAQGEQQKLQTFLTVLEKGSSLAKVEKVITVWRKPTEYFETFEIKF